MHSVTHCNPHSFITALCTRYHMAEHAIPWGVLAEQVRRRDTRNAKSTTLHHRLKHCLAAALHPPATCTASWLSLPESRPARDPPLLLG